MKYKYRYGMSIVEAMLIVAMGAVFIGTGATFYETIEEHTKNEILYNDLKTKINDGNLKGKIPLLYNNMNGFLEKNNNKVHINFSRFMANDCHSIIFLEKQLIKDFNVLSYEQPTSWVRDNSINGGYCTLDVNNFDVIMELKNETNNVIQNDDKKVIPNIEHVLSNPLGRFNAYSLLGFPSAQYYYEFKNDNVNQVLIDHKKNVVVEEHKISSKNNLDIVEALTLEETSKIENGIPVFELKEHVWLMPDAEYQKIGEHITQNISINTSDEKDFMYNNLHWDKLTNENIDKLINNNTQKTFQSDAKVWHVSPRDTVNDILLNWSKKAGWSVDLKTNQVYEVKNSADFEGDFISAVTSLLKSVNNTSPRFKAVFHSGNKVLVVNDALEN